MWRRCVAGAWRLKSPVENNSWFPSATLVDLGMSRVKEDNKCDWETALAWSVCAKNSLISSKGKVLVHINLYLKGMSTCQQFCLINCLLWKDRQKALQ